MRSRLTILLTLGALALALATPAGAAAPKLPSQAKITAAVKSAESSSGLWATINICNTKKHPGTVGIRAQMPALGFASNLNMRIQLEYYSVATGNFTPVKGAVKSLSAANISSGFQQQGVDFHVSSKAVLSAQVTFSWVAGSKTLGTVTKSTASGIKNVQQADPAGYSAADCRIGG